MGWDAKRLVKQTALRLLARPPLWPALRRYALRGDPLTVLCYHTLGPDSGGPDAWTVLRMADFRAQVETLRRHYDIVRIDEALSDAGSARKGRPRAVLTFDDGEAGLHRFLLPFVEAERLPVTVYVATGQIESGRPYWFDRVMNALQVDEPIRLDLGDVGLPAWDVPAGGGAAGWAVLSDILETLKSVSPDDRERLADRIVASLPASQPARSLAPMTQAELAELAASPWVTVGAHSHCHNLLDQIPPEAARDSIDRSRALLQKWTGQAVEHFAYPNGNDNETLRRIVAGLGFRSATVLGQRLARAGTDPFALPRLAIGRYDRAERFRLRLAEI